MRAYLTSRFFVAFACAQFAGTLSLLFPSLLVPYLATWPLAILLLAVDRFTLPRGNAVRTSVRTENRFDSGQHFSATVTVFAPAKPSRAFRGEVFAPQSERVHFHGARAEWKVRAGEQTSVPLEGRAAELGYEEWRSVELIVHSRWGLWLLAGPSPIEPVSFRVFPQRSLTAQQAFEELARNQPLLLSGTRRLMRDRDASQFHSIRPYRYPDPMRHTDAKKSARYQQLMTRVFDALQAHHLVVGLDTGRASLGEIGGSAKHDFYLSASLTLAENALLNHDLVSFCAFSQKVHHVIHRAQRFNPFLTLFKGNAELRPREEESSFDTFVQRLSILAPQRSLVFLLTDFSKPSVQSALLRALPAISRKHLVMVAGVVERRYELSDSVLAFDGVLTNDRYSPLLYQYWLGEEIRRFQMEAVKIGVGSVLVHEHDWMDVVRHLYARMRSSVRI